MKKRELQKRGLTYPKEPDYAAIPEESIPQVFQHIRDVKDIKMFVLILTRANFYLNFRKVK